MAPDDNDIIAHLKDFSPNSVYFLASKQVVIRGFEYYRQDHLGAYAWNGAHTSLAASVRGTRLYRVTFSVKREQLTFACTCPTWTRGSNCKHVICALLTTINLLSPQTFRLPDENHDRRHTLLADLLPGHPLVEQLASIPRDRYEIVLAVKGAFQTLSIRKNGEEMGSRTRLPSELKQLPTDTYYFSPFARQHLLTYLTRHGNRHPIVLQTAKEDTTLEWSPSLHYESKTQIHVSGETVDIRVVGLLDDTVHEHLYPLPYMVANLETLTLAPLNDIRGWSMYQYLQRLTTGHAEQVWQEYDLNDILDDSTPPPGHAPHPFLESIAAGGSLKSSAYQPLQIPLEQLQSIQIMVSQTTSNDLLHNLILKVEGTTVSLDQDTTTATSPHIRYRVTIDPEDAPSCTLKAECLVGDTQGNPAVSTFLFFPLLENSGDLPPAFRAKMRKIVLYDAFFRLLAVHQPSHATRVIRDALDGDEFAVRHVKSAAKALLNHFHAAFMQPEARLLFAEGRWVLVPIDKAQEALLYSIPFELFGPQVFDGMWAHDEMGLPINTLHAQLPQLFARFQQAGIELRYRDKPIVSAEWDFSFDARQTSGINWLEIHPTILCDGARVDHTDLEALLNRGGMREDDDTVQIIDTNTEAVLRSLSAIYSGITTDTKSRKEIVHIPRLQILDWIALRRQGVTVTLSEHDEALIQRLLEFKTIETPRLPRRLKGKLRPYQKAGYAWLAFHYHNRFGACLADDMGLGKTLQAISLLAGIKERIILPPVDIRTPHLLVLPPSLLFNWEQEISRFYPDLTIHSYTGKERSAVFKDCDVVMTTYGLLRKDIDTLEQILFHVIIFDEAQAIKNIYADTTGAARRLKAYFKMVMTGTPVENHVGEYYSLIDLCLPGLLGEYDRFKSVTKRADFSYLETLFHRTKPFVLRRTKDKILKELPAKIETDVYLELTPRQKALYQQTVKQITSTIGDAYRSKTQAQARIIALTAILKLRQVCLSPQLLNPALTATEPSPKVEFLIGKLQELMEEGHSALVFSQFTSFLDIVEDVVQRTKIPLLRLDGSTPIGKRKTLVAKFQEGESPSVFLLSLKAGGQGLNLTKASYVFHLDPWWNPAVETQASDRAHRMGQRKAVSITRILMHHTIEEKMMELKKHKLALYNAIMEGTGKKGTGASLSKADFDFLLERAPA